MRRDENPIIGRPCVSGHIGPAIRSMRTDPNRVVEIVQQWTSPQRRGVALMPERGSSCTYRAVEVRRGDGPAVFVLLHFAYPLVGFVHPPYEWHKQFIDFDELARLLADEFEVYSAASLNAKLDHLGEMRPHLDSADLWAIRNYKPRSIGEFVFNEWD